VVIHNPRPRGPRTLAARASTAEAVTAELRARIDDGTIRRVTLLVPDPHARFAAVELGARFFADTVLEEGYGLCTYAFAWTPERAPVTAPVFEPYTTTYGDLRLQPDTCSVLPDGDDGVFVVCDVADVEFAPRTVLRRQVELAEAAGYVPSAGIEHEVTFTTPSGEPLVAEGLDYAAGGLDPLRSYLTAVRYAVEELGVESLRGECHPGQYEVVLGHRDALAACDDALLQQLLIRRVAAEHGVRAGYLAAERPGAGSSCHVHISLSPGFPLEHFIAGVLRAAPDLTPFWAPTWNSYVRLRTADFSPRAVRWGVDDRTASVRVAGSGESRRAEVRFAGADAQPHLVVAAILAAGLWGIREELTPPEPSELPSTPWEARAALASSDLARELLGESVVEAQVAHLDEEIASACEAVTDWQRRRGDLRR
jgi:glutamine synthetase